jgi:hypothetical protein
VLGEFFAGKGSSMPRTRAFKSGKSQATASPPLKSKLRMSGSETLVFRASLKPRLYRAIEIAPASSLYQLAQAIIRSFDFDFDHPFGFYSNLKGNIYKSPVRYELFVDMGEDDGEARSVRRTRVTEAFPSNGIKMRLLFDYGDHWEFLVEFVERKLKEPQVKLPRVLTSVGEAPPQYADPEDE